mgnify:CR=1 FL=1
MTLQASNPIWDKIDAHIEQNVDYWIDQLARLCAQPSVSAQNYGITECADLVATMLREQGFRAEVMPSDGYPVVYGEGDGCSDKTLLFYLHYDVQPAEPLELWDSPPFQLTEREAGRVFELQAVFPPGFSSPPGAAPELRLDSSHPQFRTLRIPIEPGGGLSPNPGR